MYLIDSGQTQDLWVDETLLPLNGKLLMYWCRWAEAQSGQSIVLRPVGSCKNILSVKAWRLAVQDWIQLVFCCLPQLPRQCAPLTSLPGREGLVQVQDLTKPLLECISPSIPRILLSFAHTTTLPPNLLHSFSQKRLSVFSFRVDLHSQLKLELR